MDLAMTPDVAYVVEYVDADGRERVTAFVTSMEARDWVERIVARGGRVSTKRVERGAEATALLRAVLSVADDAGEVF